jgi:hypothetical protein
MLLANPATPCTKLLSAVSDAVAKSAYCSFQLRPTTVMPAVVASTDPSASEPSPSEPM